MSFFKHQDKKIEENFKEPKAETKMQYQREDEAVHNGLLAFALLKDKVFDLELIQKKMKEQANLEIYIDRDNKLESFIVKVPQGTFVCTHILTPIPDHEAEKNLKFNFMEPQVAEDIKNHQSFIVIGRLNEPTRDIKEACTVFSKIGSVLMDLPNAAAMYLGGLGYLISPNRYKAFLPEIMEAERRGVALFPIPLWIKVDMYQTDEGIQASTRGMSQFGLNEVGFYRSRKKPQEIFELIMSLCNMALIQKCVFKDGDSVNLDSKGATGTVVLHEDTLFIVEK